MKTFNEKSNTAVFTTRFVIERISPILFVFHFNDGSWQFSGPEENLSDGDFRVIALDEVIEIDSTVLEIADMPLGCEAFRIDRDSPWRIHPEN